ncbi:hypothetical protein LR002_03075 [Candidatus Gracilibacteria bacterium]|nr:hypothetical protein [Candidatus Gracilibacteria bacterium]
MKKIFFLPGLEKTLIKVFNEDFQNEQLLEIEKGENENEKIFDFFKKNDLKLEEIAEIFFCNGPGRFMSMRISAVIANLFKNQNSSIKLFSISTVKFFAMKTQNLVPIFLQLNNSEIFTLINGEEKVYLRGDLEKKFLGEEKIFYFGNLKKGLFDFENFEKIDVKKILPDEKILQNISKNGEKFLTQQVKIFYGK